MYNLSNQLKKLGFNIDLLRSVIERNGNLMKFNTLEYFCIYVFFNDFEIKVDGKIINVVGGHAVYVGPFKTVEFVKSVQTDIYVVVFTSQFYEKSKKDSLFLNSEVFYNHTGHVQAMPFFGTTEYVRMMMTERLKYYQGSNRELYLSVAHGIIESLLSDALLYIIPKNEGKGEVVNFQSIGNNFKTLLQKNIREHHTVSYYASQLCITDKKLTKIVRNLYGQTTKQIIIQKLCDECVIAITHSNLTISEISFEFGFSCESNFTNFIRKHTGKNPTELRMFPESS